MSDPISSSSPSDDPTRVPLTADLPRPYGGVRLPEPPTPDALSAATPARPHPAEADWSDDEKDALELSDDDLDLVAGGLPTPRPVSDAHANRLFRSSAYSASPTRPEDE